MNEHDLHTIVPWEIRVGNPENASWNVFVDPTIPDQAIPRWLHTIRILQSTYSMHDYDIRLHGALLKTTLACYETVDDIKTKSARYIKQKPFINRVSARITGNRGFRFDQVLLGMTDLDGILCISDPAIYLTIHYPHLQHRTPIKWSEIPVVLASDQQSAQSLLNNAYTRLFRFNTHTHLAIADD